MPFYEEKKKINNKTHISQILCPTLSGCGSFNCLCLSLRSDQPSNCPGLGTGQLLQLAFFLVLYLFVFYIYSLTKLATAQVLELVNFCSSRIFESLSEDNALEIGMFGEMHNSEVGYDKYEHKKGY